MNTNRLPFTAILLLIFLSGFSFAQNYQIRQTISMNGQKSETIVYVRGSRKRIEGGGFMGMGNDVATVEQCDLKRNVRINDQKKLYVIELFDDGTETTQQANQSKAREPKSQIRKGGVVTYISNTTDTGERKQMFGLTARHIKTSMKIEASPDACLKTDMRMETDGWYVDLPEFSCPVSRMETPQMPAEPGGGGCRDQVQFRNTGSGKLGIALQETRTMTSGGTSFTQTTETLEFSRGPLDAVLFDIPNGYTVAKNSSDLYGTPDYSKIMQNPPNVPDNQENPVNNPISAVKPKGAGVIRIGVYAPNNKTSESISLTYLQTFLVQKLSGGQVEAVRITGEAEARAMSCDYVLTSDISKLKLSTAGKIGGLFGKVTSTDTSGMKDYEAQVDFKLVSLADGKTVTQKKAANKFKGDADKAAESVLSIEAQQVLSAIQK